MRASPTTVGTNRIGAQIGDGSSSVTCEEIKDSDFKVADVVHLCRLHETQGNLVIHVPMYMDITLS